MSQADIGLIGLAVMGENLVLNMESKGFTVAVYNRTVSKVDDFTDGRGAGQEVHRLPLHRGPWPRDLKSPRKVMIMVKAGQAVDDTIEQLIPVLSPGRHHHRRRQLATTRTRSGARRTSRARASLHRHRRLRRRGGRPPRPLHHAGRLAQGLARREADLPGDRRQGPGRQPLLRLGRRGRRRPLREDGAQRHRVRRHAAHLRGLPDHAGRPGHDGRRDAARSSTSGTRASSTATSSRSPATSSPTRTRTARPSSTRSSTRPGQKGTGKWTGIAALDQGVPLTLIAEAVFARCLSAPRTSASPPSRGLRRAPRAKRRSRATGRAFLDDLRDALYASKIVSYAQGFLLLRAAAAEYGWKLNYGGIALMWRGGCIIRSAFLGKIKEAFDAEPDLANLLLAPFFRDKIAEAESGWREVVADRRAEPAFPCPAISAALAYFDGYRCERLPANLLQAQRDYFGAHTYERVDEPRGKFFHTNWTGRGGTTSSSTYSA